MCYHLSCGVEIFISTFALLFVKANSKKICEEISFPSLFRKIAEVSIFVEIQGLFSWKNVRIPPGPTFLYGFQLSH